MQTITVRDLDDDVLDALGRRAFANGRSLDEELRAILTRAAQDLPSPPSTRSDKADDARFVRRRRPAGRK